MSLPMALLLSELCDKKSPYEVSKGCGNEDNLFLTLMNTLDIDHFLRNRIKQTFQLSWSDQRLNCKTIGSSKKHVTKASFGGADRSKKNGNYPLKYQVLREAKIQSPWKLPPTSNRKLRDRKPLPSSMNKTNALSSAQNPRAIYPSAPNKKSRHSNLSANSVRKAKENSFSFRNNSNLKYLNSLPKKKFTTLNSSSSRQENNCQQKLSNSIVSSGEKPYSILTSAVPEYCHSKTLELVEPPKSSPVRVAETSKIEIFSESFLTSLSEAITETNNKLNDIIRGCSMDTISPFLFFDKKEFDEEIVIHKALFASRRAFLHRIPENEELKLDVEGTWTNPETVCSSPQLTNDLLEKASSSKLSVHAAPFTFKPHILEGIPVPPKMNAAAFLDFVSRIDDETLKSLAPPENRASPTYLQPDEEKLLKEDEFLQSKPAESFNRPPVELEGQELSVEDEKKANSSSLGPIGNELKPDGQPEASSPVKIRVMYGGRGVLDLGANLLGQWSGINRWQVGPEQNVRITRPMPTLPFIAPEGPLFGCGECFPEPIKASCNSDTAEN